ERMNRQERARSACEQCFRSIHDRSPYGLGKHACVRFSSLPENASQGGQLPVEQWVLAQLGPTHGKSTVVLEGGLHAGARVARVAVRAFIRVRPAWLFTTQVHRSLRTVVPHHRERERMLDG